MPASQLQAGDLVMVTAGELIPGDGDIVEGIASVDESAITGESAPVIRESGGDRSAVTAGTKVLSDWIKVRITAGPGESFLDRMISLVEGAERQKTPNEIALSILLAKFTIIFLIVCVALQPFAIYSGSRLSDAVLIALFVCLIPTTIGGLLSAIGIAGMDRLVQHNVLAMSGRAVEAAGDVSTLLLGQDRHDHAGEPPGRRLPPRTRRRRGGAGRGRAVRVARRRDARRPVHRRAGEGAIRHPRAGAARDARAVRPVHGADPDERRRPGRERDPQGRGRRDRRVVRARDGSGDERGRRADRPRRRDAAGGCEGPPAPGRHRAEGHHQGGTGRAVRAAAEDGDPHRDDHGRQPAHRRRDRAGVGRRRLPRRGDPRDEDGPDQARAGGRACSSP